MTINPKFKIKQDVVLKYDPDKLTRIVYGYIVYDHVILYRLACGTQTSDHYEFEITGEKTEVIVAGFQQH